MVGMMSQSEAATRRIRAGPQLQGLIPGCNSQRKCCHGLYDSRSGEGEKIALVVFLGRKQIWWASDFLGDVYAFV